MSDIQMGEEPASGVSRNDSPIRSADREDIAMNDVDISNSDDTSHNSVSEHEENRSSEWSDGLLLRIPMYDPDGPVQTSDHMGELINREFGTPYENDHEYVDDEARDIFDDGLDSDEFPDYSSGASATDEELHEPASVVIKIEATSKENTALGSELECNDSDSWHRVSEFDVSLGVTEEVQGDEVKHEDGFSSFDLETRDIIVPEMTETALLPLKTFAELRDQKYELLYQKSEAALGGNNHPFEATVSLLLDQPVISLAEDADIIRCNILGLQEKQGRIQQELEDLYLALKTAEAKKHSADDILTAHFAAAGISLELYNAYEAFCDSLDPEFGQRGGFDIICYGDHEGSYIRYDPSLALFKQFVETPYSTCNFRSEASVEKAWWGPTNEYVVQFWPLKSPEPLHGTATTWGEQYPELYILATTAARSGSHAALEMLIALPDMNSSFAGGWLFDYQFEPKLCNEPIASKRWRFRSAHQIDATVDDEEKKRGAWRCC